LGHALHARSRGNTSTPCSFDRLGQQLLNAGFARVLPAARQARRGDRRLGLQMRFARVDLIAVEMPVAPEPRKDPDVPNPGIRLPPRVIDGKSAI
jgi:hypothetical protein